MKTRNADLSFNISNQRNQLILGLVMVLIFGALGGALMNQQSRTFKVLVAAKDIASGVKLGARDVQIIEISGSSLPNALESLPKSAISAQAIRAGDVISSTQITGVLETAAVVSFEFPQVELPVDLTVGDSVELWQVVPAEIARGIGEAEILEIADTRYDQSKKVSMRVQPGLVAEVLMASAELKIVRIT